MTHSSTLPPHYPKTLPPIVPSSSLSRLSVVHGHARKRPTNDANESPVIRKKRKKVNAKDGMQSSNGVETNSTQQQHNAPIKPSQAQSQQNFQHFLALISSIQASNLTLLYSHFQLSYSQSEFSESEFRTVVREVESLLRNEADQKLAQKQEAFMHALDEKRKKEALNQATRDKENIPVKINTKRSSKRLSFSLKGGLSLTNSALHPPPPTEEETIANLMDYLSNRVDLVCTSDHIIFSDSWILDAFDILDRKELCAVSMESLFLLVCLMIGRHRLFLRTVWHQFSGAIWELLRSDSTESCIDIKRARSVALLARIDDWLVTKAIWELNWFQHYNQDMMNNSCFITRDMFISLYDWVFRIVDNEEDNPQSVSEFLQEEVDASKAVAQVEPQSIVITESPVNVMSTVSRFASLSTDPSSKYAADLTYPFAEGEMPTPTGSDISFPTVDSRTIIPSRNSMRLQREERVRKLFRRRKKVAIYNDGSLELDRKTGRGACCSIM